MSEIYQGHGDHWSCIFDDPKEFISTLPEIIKNANLYDIAKQIEVGDNVNGIYDVAYLEHPISQEIHICIQLLIDREKNQNLITTFYPVIKSGLKILLTINQIIEWDSLTEAIIIAQDTNGHNYQFFDYYYGLNKHKYNIGQTYLFSITGLITQAHIPEKTFFTFEGDKALAFLDKIGENPEDPENVTPIKFDTSQLKAFFQTNQTIPQLAEFQFPLESVKEIPELDLYRFEGIIYEDCGKIPIFCKRNLLNKLPEKDDPLQGLLFLQGYCL